MKPKHTSWMAALLLVVSLASCVPYANVGVSANYGRPYRYARPHRYVRPYYAPPVVVAPRPYYVRPHYAPRYEHRAPRTNGSNGYQGGSSRGPR